MIPKIIHYCWFGPKPIPEKEQECMKSWTKYLPDYTLMFWNEQTFDINKYTFAKEAYEKKMYAFVSDFVRVYALQQYGGIYMDTDVEIINDLSDVLSKADVILGFENSTNIGTALMASVVDHQVMTDLVDYYTSRSFINNMGLVDITANPMIFASVLKKYGVVFNGEQQEVSDIMIYKREVFFPKKIKDNQFIITNDCLAIHHFSASWLTDRQKKRGSNKLWLNVFRPILKHLRHIIELICGEKNMQKIEIIIRNILK